MERKDAPAPNGPETFDRLKARLGRLPTVDELSRELLTDRIRHGHPTDHVGRTRRAPAFTIVGVIGFLLLAVLFFVGRQPDLQQLASPDATVPDLPPAPPAAIPPPPLPAPTPARNLPALRRVEDTAIQRRVLPDIPASARRTITGRVRINIRVSVDPSGNVIEASSASPDASRYFTGLAEKAAREWKFAPAPPDRADAARAWVIRFELGRQDTTAAVDAVGVAD